MLLPYTPVKLRVGLSAVAQYISERLDQLALTLFLEIFHSKYPTPRVSSSK